MSEPTKLLGQAAGELVERWRQEGTWTSKIPDEFILVEKRVDWAFWFTNDRGHGPGMEAVLAADASMGNFVGFHLPHKVKYGMHDDRLLPNAWLAENVSGAWQHFGAREGHMYFEHYQDAFHFKMVHYDGR